MPNIKSAEKRVLVSRRRHQENKIAISEMKTAIKKFNTAIDTNNVEEAERLLPITVSIIDTAASKGMIHKNNASNKKSNLARKLSDVKSGKIVVTIKKDNKTIAAEKAKAAQDARDKVKAENQVKKEEAAAIRAKAAADKAAAEKAAKKAPKAKAKKETASKDESTRPAAKKKSAKKAVETDEAEKSE